MSDSITATALVVERDAFRLGPLDLAVSSGEYVVLVGPSGAGKTLLVETLLGFNRVRSGEVLLDHEPVSSLSPAARRCAYLPQDLGILPHLSVRRNLTWGLDCARRSAEPNFLERVIGVLGLGPLLDRKDPGTLSRGEQQRVALGRALLTQPRRLLLDEPCAALDPHVRRDLQLLLRALHEEFATTVVHVTHDREEAFLLGNRIAVLLAGRLHQVSTPEALYRRPADLAVARFIASENLWSATLVAAGTDGLVVHPDGTDTAIRVAPSGIGSGPLAWRSGTTAFLGIRPEEVSIVDEATAAVPDTGSLSGEIADLLRLEGTVQVVVATDAGLKITARMPAAAARNMGLAVGRRAAVRLPADALYVLWE